MLLNYKTIQIDLQQVKQALISLLLLLLLASCSKEAGLSRTTPKLRQHSHATPEMQETARIQFEANLIEGMKYYVLNEVDESIYFLEKALTYKKDGACYYTLAKLYYSKNDVAKSTQYTELAVQQDPSNHYYAEQLARLYEVQKKYDDAVHVLKGLIKQYPNSIEYQYDLASIYVYQTKYSEAIDEYRNIEKHFGYTSEVTRQIQQIYIKQNNLNAAINEGYTLIKNDPSEIEFQLMQAEFLITNARYVDADSLLNKILLEHPGNQDALIHRYQLHLSRAEKDLAYLDAKQIVSDAQFNEDDVAKLLEDLVKNGGLDNDKVSSLLLLAQKNFPNNYQIKILSAQTLLKSSNKEEARLQLLSSVKQDPNNYNVWLTILNTDNELSWYDSMAVDAKASLEYFPNQSVLWYYSGLANYMTKQYKRAADDLEQCKKLSSKQPEIKLLAASLLGDTYNETKNYVKSDENYDLALTIDRNNVHVLNNYSYFLSVRKEKLDLAKDLIERLMKQNPGEASYIDTYGWVLYQMKDYENARKQLEIAVSLKKDGTIYEHYGDVLYQLGDKDKAVEMWVEAKKLGEASSLLDKKIKDKKMYE